MDKLARSGRGIEELPDCEIDEYQRGKAATFPGQVRGLRGVEGFPPEQLLRGTGYEDLHGWV